MGWRWAVGLVLFAAFHGVLASPVARATAEPDLFIDDDFSVHEADIQALAVAGVTSGCSADARFCPDEAVTRGELAAFVTTGLPVPAVSGPAPFTDTAGHFAEAAVAALAAANLTSGCGSGMYCPDAPVTRAQAATLLANALGVPHGATDAFDDDTGHVLEPGLDRAYAAGIISGCGVRQACPDVTLTRGQMATLLARALGLDPVPAPAANDLPREITLIVIDHGDQTVTMYDAAGHVLRHVPASTGLYYQPVGTFAIFSKSEIAYAGSLRLAYMSRFLPTASGKAVGLHGVPVRADGTPLQQDDELGVPASHGCIRLRQVDAHFIYDWAPIGTPVVAQR